MPISIRKPVRAAQIIINRCWLLEIPSLTEAPGTLLVQLSLFFHPSGDHFLQISHPLLSINFPEFEIILMKDCNLPGHWVLTSPLNTGLDTGYGSNGVYWQPSGEGVVCIR